MNDDYLMLMANPQKIKTNKNNSIQIDNLYIHIRSKFNIYNDDIIQDIYKSAKEYINNIDLIEIEIKYIVKNLVNLAIYNSINSEYI